MLIVCIYKTNCKTTYTCIHDRNNGEYQECEVIDVRYIGIQVSIGVHLYRYMSA